MKRVKRKYWKKFNKVYEKKQSEFSGCFIIYNLRKGKYMDNKVKVFLSAVIVIMIMSVSFHSVEEIHYFKTFYPEEFTVQDTFYASLVELVKVFLVSFPIIIAYRIIIELYKD